MNESVADVAVEQIEQDIKSGLKGPRPHFVAVLVDSVEHHVRPGRYVVKNFKRVVGVDPTYQLDQVMPDGSFVEQPDDSHIAIKGGEIFVSHVRGGGAS